MSKINFIPILFLLFVFGLQGQIEDAQEIRDFATEVMQKSIDKDIDFIIENTYPTLFDITTKERFSEILKEIMEGNELIEINFDDSIPNFNISEVFYHDEAKFAFLNYDLKFKLIYINKGFTPKVLKRIRRKLTEDGLIVKDLGKNTLEVVKPNAMIIFINDRLTKGNWNLLNYDSNNVFPDQILPKYLIEPLKDFEIGLMKSKK